ncbi:MAG: hypothetical protein ACC657_05590 [Thiohalomonadales bacterium]
MSINALASQGMTVSVGDGASPEIFTVIPELSDISGPDGSAGEIEVTDLSSTAKEFIRGLTDNGNISGTMMYIPKNTVHAQLRSDFASATEIARNYRLHFTDSPRTYWDFNAYVATLSISNSLDSVTSANLTLRIKGGISET